jgi:competence protein ComEA
VAVRGESTRVAARVRDLLSEHGDRTVVVVNDDDPPLRPGPGRPGWRQRLQARIPVRLDPGRRAVVAVGAAVLVAAVLTGLWVVAERPRALAVGPAGVAGASSPVPTGRLSASAGSSGRVPVGGASSAVPATPTAPAVLVVDVAGKVHRPGLYRLPVGSRVDDAVRAAGGALAGVNLSSLNLAAKVVDGQQIPVGIAGSPGGAAAGAAGAAGSDGSPGGRAGMAGNGAPGAGEPVDLNTATIEQLETLPGVGPVLAQHVLDWRTAHGHFATVDQLDDVPGIGEVKFAALKSLVTV